MIQFYTIIIFRFTKSEIKYLYRVFKAECPNGVLTEEMFHKIFSAFFPWGEEPYQSKMLQFDIDRKAIVSSISFPFHDCGKSLVARLV